MSVNCPTLLASSGAIELSGLLGTVGVDSPVSDSPPFGEGSGGVGALPT